MTSKRSNSTADQPFSSESEEWRRFWRVFLLATVPPVLFVFGGLEWLGSSMGETYTPDALIRALDEHPDLVWMPMRVQSLACLKLAQIAKERPEVLIMGNSRVEKVGASMFRPYTFYNLSRVSWPFNTYVDILRHFPSGYHPKVILFEADFFMFGPKYDEYFRGKAPVYGHEFSEHLLHLRDLAMQVIEHRRLVWQRTDYNGHPARGAYALEGGEGFFRDGSMRPPAAALVAGHSPEDLVRPTWKYYVTEGDKMGEREMADLKQFVDLARKMGIPLVAVQMPIYGPLLRAVEKDPNYRIFQDFRSHVAEGYFDQLGIPFFDYSSFPPYSEDNHYFYDGVHAGQPLSAAVIEAMGSDARFRALLPRLDVEELQRELEADKQSADHLFLKQ